MRQELTQVTIKDFLCALKDSVVQSEFLGKICWMDCIIEDSPNMMGGVVYPELECVDKLGIEVHKLKIEL